MELLIVVQVVRRMELHDVRRVIPDTIGPLTFAIKISAHVQMAMVQLALPALLTTLQRAVLAALVTTCQVVRVS